MNKQLIDTNVIDKSKETISSYTTQILTSLDTISNEIRTLQNTWEGKAGTYAVEEYYSKIAPLSEDFKTTMTEYLSFLGINVTEGYTDAETENMSLAEQFK
ncbi:MAG: hypothetical protein IKI97_11480 [Clostridia bacterium]|nr:hypothetical protein [Clostridia bacterium]